MDIKALLTKDYKLPNCFKDNKAIFLALLFMLLPNAVLLFASWLLNLSRPLLNTDYLIICLLFTLPFRASKILASILFFFALIFDVIMITMQLFPFMDFAAIRYLAPFLFDAPTRYLILIALTAIYLISMPITLNKLAKYVAWQLTLVWAIVLGILAYFLHDVSYKTVPAEYFGRTNYFIIESQTMLYTEHYGSDFIALTRTEPVLSEGPKEYASKYLNTQPYASKILFVVAESWGTAREATVQREILQKIYDQQDHLAFIKDGHFDFAGATVNGELRELCQLRVDNGYALSKTPDEKFASCWSNHLKNKGYHTIALHGASSQLYDRLSWYQKAGFQETIFAENLPDKTRCYAFHGVCDHNLTDVVADKFKQANANNQNILFYWLTLTTHAPYAQTDMVNPRLDCKKYDLFEGDICNNMRLTTQFFDDLAELIKKPEMKGVEVIVVGDHMPPIMGDKPLHKNLRWSEVSWLHFKVK